VNETFEGHALPEMIAALPAGKSAAWIEALAQAECPALTARRARRAEISGVAHDPIVWVRARGSNVWDADSNRYVDLSAGFGAAAVGHNHPRVMARMRAQSETLVHALGDMHPSDVKIALLARLAELAPFEDARVMLGLSGSDAITAALKTAVLATGKPGVLAFHGGYHGLDYAPLAACGFSEAFRAPFAAQLNPHVSFAEYPAEQAALERSLSQVAQALAHARTPIGAVLVEPIQGRGGMITPPALFLGELAALCAQHGALLVLDAIMAGLGRNGVYPFGVERFGLEHDVRFDLVCLGKALGGGLPISACIGRAEVMAAWGAAATRTGGVPLHTGTFFGNPLACASALAALDVLEGEALPQRALQNGAGFTSALRERLGERVRAVRGAGLMIGIDTGSVARGLAIGQRLLELGYITVPAGDGSIVSLTPALNIHPLQLEAFAEALVPLVEALP
jgi:4-aminobutyrate aminotransferase/(S)-3-amino-2-methylpropionate transaminase